jgi:hypothetical protein
MHTPYYVMLTDDFATTKVGLLTRQWYFGKKKFAAEFTTDPGLAMEFASLEHAHEGFRVVMAMPGPQPSWQGLRSVTKEEAYELLVGAAL